MTFRSILKFTLTFTVALGLGIGTAVAQDYTTGTIEGIVRDNSGAMVPGATVEISSDRGVRRSAITDNDGFFRAPRLPIGNYTVNVSAVGYKDLADQAVRVNIGDSASYAFTLESESLMMEEVYVTGTRRGTWDFTSTTTGISVDVVDLAEKFPVQRNLTDIALFAPGTAQGDLAFGNLASFSGGSVAENAYYINGMNVTNFRNFTGSSVVPFEFYEQVEVKTGGYQAEFGRSIGGFTNSVTKSGSNELHGGIYMVYSPENMYGTRKDIKGTNAWNSFDEDDQFELIGELSGPLIKDKLFFYAMYNHRQLDQVDVSASRKVYTYDHDPFWGTKIDFVPFDGHRFEATIWTDETKVRTDQYVFNPNGVDREDATRDMQGSYIGSGVAHTGGRNEIYRYSGVFTDWFTISAMWGKNRFERTALSSTDLNPIVFERLTNPNSSVTIGDWTNTTRSIGRDEREAWRVDADFYFNFMGDHHVRVGIDEEDLTAIENLEYTGGEYWRYQYCTQPTCFNGQLTEGEEYVRHIIYRVGGEFKVEQSAVYIQDSWEFSDNWRLNVGLRNETFKNLNAAGESFIEADNQLAPRIGVIWDPTGDGTNRVTAFYGRYFMPIAANTNIRMAGEELYIEEYLRHAGYDSRIVGPDIPTGVDFNNPLQFNLISDGEIPDTATIKDQTVDPLYSDEFILGYEHVFENGIIVGVRGMYRELAVQIDDVGINPATVAWAVDNGYAYEDVAWIIDPAQHPIDYVLTNPGTDMRVATDLLTDDGSLVWMDLTKEQLGYPEPKRKYKALEFTFSRPWDGVWELNGNYTYSTVRGNTEGVVKSDNGQDDAGLTQDFDLVGVMLNAYGPLPTENEHRLKLWGSYQVFDWMRVGGRFILQSPRKYGCIGVLPDGTFSDPVRNNYEARYDDDYWFCDGKPTPRGSQLESDWLTQLDLSLTITPAFAENMPGELQFRIDMFNVLDSSAKTDLDEYGETYAGRGVGNPSEFYGTPTAYQQPRRIALFAQWKF